MASHHSSTPIFDEEDDYLIQASQISIDSVSDEDESPPPMQELSEKEEGLLESTPADGSSELLECKLLVQPRGMRRSIAMDMEEIKACRDLGIDFPCDWKVEILGGGFDSSGSSTGVNSPSSDWSIFSPGDNPTVIKARLKMWAHAVALASVNLNSDHARPGTQEDDDLQSTST